MIDVIAGLFSAALIDRQGKFFREKDIARIVNIDNKPCYLLADQEKSGTNKPIIITEPDINNIIRTKGAIFSGITTLLNYVSIDINDIDEILIAGGLGKNIDFKNAVSIGLLPDIPLEKYKYLGNAALHRKLKIKISLNVNF